MATSFRARAAAMIALFGLASLALTGCGTADIPAVERDDQGHLVPYADLVDPYPGVWGLGTAQEPEMIDERIFVIYFDNPVEPTCIRHNLEIVENESTVTITLMNGLIVDHAQFKCPLPMSGMEARAGSMLVELDAPLGDRQIVNGNPVTGHN